MFHYVFEAKHLKARRFSERPGPGAAPAAPSPSAPCARAVCKPVGLWCPPSGARSSRHAASRAPASNLRARFVTVPARTSPIPGQRGPCRRLGAWQHHSELGKSQGCCPSCSSLSIRRLAERINVPEGNVIYFFPCTGRRRSQYPRP